MNRRKLSNKGLVTPDGFWKTFFKVIGVMASIIGYVVFLHERDEKIKEIVQNDVHSKIYGNSANKSNSDDYLSPTHQDARQAILVSSKSNSNKMLILDIRKVIKTLQSLFFAHLMISKDINY